MTDVHRGRCRENGGEKEIRKRCIRRQLQSGKNRRKESNAER